MNKTRLWMLAGSVTNANSDDIFDSDITGGSEPGRATEFQEMQDVIFGG